MKRIGYIAIVMLLLLASQVFALDQLKVGDVPICYGTYKVNVYSSNPELLKDLDLKNLASEGQGSFTGTCKDNAVNEIVIVESEENAKYNFVISYYFQKVDINDPVSAASKRTITFNDVVVPSKVVSPTLFETQQFTFLIVVYAILIASLVLFVIVLLFWQFSKEKTAVEAYQERQSKKIQEEKIWAEIRKTLHKQK